MSSGAHASIGPIANSGAIVGNIDIQNQSVTITGGIVPPVGSLTGGTIDIENGNLTFGGGNTFLGDGVSVDGGAGTIFNEDPLMVSSPITITGNFDQDSSGVLDLLFAGDLAGQYGALDISGAATLAGALASPRPAALTS